MQIHMSRHGDDLEPTSTLLECASCMASVTDFESFCTQWQKSMLTPQASGLRVSQDVEGLGCLSAPGISVLREHDALSVIDDSRRLPTSGPAAMASSRMSHVTGCWLPDTTTRTSSSSE